MTTIATQEQRANVFQWPAQGDWTYDDYARLPDKGNRYEVIKGDLYMSPVPRPKHQRVSLDLAVELQLHVKEQGLGEIYEAPIDVILPERATPVQPDILFIAKERLGIAKASRAWFRLNLVDLNN